MHGQGLFGVESWPAEQQNEAILYEWNDWKQRIEAEMPELESSMLFGLLDARIEALRTENRITKSELRDLKAVTKPYLDVRNRWIANYIKNKRSDRLTPADIAIIETGNSASHYGDPLTDAQFYIEKVRSDPSIYKDLYGFGSGEVTEYLSAENENNRKALGVLANHANVEADTVIESVPYSFFISFMNFMDGLEVGGWSTEQLQVESTPEAQLYSKFKVEFDAIKDKLHK